VYNKVKEQLPGCFHPAAVPLGDKSWSHRGKTIAPAPRRPGAILIGSGR